MLRHSCVFTLLSLCLAGAFAQQPAGAQPRQAPPAAKAQAQAPAAPAPADASPGSDQAPARNEPAVKRTHIEDDNARIDELRIRGETKRITVQPKKGGVPYEVLPLDASRDRSQEGARGAGGQSVWHFLSF